MNYLLNLFQNLDPRLLIHIGYFCLGIGWLISIVLYYAIKLNWFGWESKAKNSKLIPFTLKFAYSVYIGVLLFYVFISWDEVKHKSIALCFMVAWLIGYIYLHLIIPRSDKLNKQYFKFKIKYFIWPKDAGCLAGHAEFHNSDIYREPYKSKLPENQREIEFFGEILNKRVWDGREVATVFIKPLTDKAESNYQWAVDVGNSNAPSYETVHVDETMILSKTPMKFNWLLNKLVAV